MAQCLVYVMGGRLGNPLKSGGWRVRRSVRTGPGDVIQHGVNGILCAPDEQDISAAIRTLLSDASLRDRLASQARFFVAEHHSQESVAAREAEVIGHLIGS